MLACGNAVLGLEASHAPAIPSRKETQTESVNAFHSLNEKTLWKGKLIKVW
jgi:hypothetical protein